MQLAELKLGSRPWTAPLLYISPRMGGGPRTFPGGVSKWQWKRMQEKKSKQILKARLLRERQLYEMRKRAELKAADLERPWEITRATKAPTLFAVTADDQLQAMADRFVKPGAMDLWTDKDGPNSHSFGFVTQEGKPSARVFPRDALYSTQPYSLASSLSPAQSYNGHSSSPSPSRYLPQKRDASNPSLTRYPPPQAQNGRRSNSFPVRDSRPQNLNDRSTNPSSSRYRLQNHNGRSSDASLSHYPPQNHNGGSSNPSLCHYPPRNDHGRSSNSSPSRYPLSQTKNSRSSKFSPSRYSPPQTHNGRGTNLSSSRYPPHPSPRNSNSMSSVGKSIVSRSISVLSSVSGQGDFNDAHVRKESPKHKSVKDTGRQRHRFLASPEPSRADNYHSNNTKSPVSNNAGHTFAGFDLEYRSTPRLREGSHKSKTDVN